MEGLQKLNKELVVGVQQDGCLEVQRSWVVALQWLRCRTVVAEDEIARGRRSRNSGSTQ